MKKFYTPLLLIMLILLVQQQLAAQGIHKFWGLTPYGGQDDGGVLFSTRSDAAYLQVQQSFTYLSPGGAPWEMPLIEYNGKLYGATSTGGYHKEGAIFEYDMTSAQFKKCADLYTIGGRSKVESLTLWNNKLYGTTNRGGDNDEGILFEYDLTSKTLVKKVDFMDQPGSYPQAALTLFNGKLYGVTQIGGVNNLGIIFTYDPATAIFQYEAEFNAQTTGYDIRSRFVVHNGKLYASCYKGGLADRGTIIEFDPQAKTVTRKGDFDNIGAINVSYGGLTVFNGKLYGGSREGGTAHLGMIFEYNPAAGTLVKKIDLDNTKGTFCSQPMTVYGNKLYGTTIYGGNTNDGVIFEYDPVSNTYTKKVNMGGSPGSNPLSQLFLYKDKLYGTTSQGGILDNGTLFEYNPLINGIQVKGIFSNSDGHTPEGDVTLYNGKLYGVTSQGGQHGLGVIYSYDPGSHTYSLLHHMQNATGNFLLHGGLTLHNNKLYGATLEGGLDNDGVIFEFDPATNTYSKKVDLGSVGGQRPRGKLAVFNNKLYGTTALGGNTNDGIIYEYDPVANNLSLKVHMGPAFGKYPYGTLTLYNGKFYGITNMGGATDEGTLFEYDPSINGIIKRVDFNAALGVRPAAGLALLDGKLYGTTSEESGGAPVGTLFEYNPVNFTITKKFDFNNSQTKYPISTLMPYRGRLYGLTTRFGLEDIGGALFEFIPENNSYTEKILFDGRNGRSSRYSQLTAIPAPTAHGTPGACEEAIMTETVSAHNQWIAFTNQQGDAVVEINPNGNNLGRIGVRFYVHDGNTRTDNKGNFYLDRNITIEVQQQPIRPVQVRLYIRSTEFDKLAKTAGSGVINPEDITVFKNSDPCANAIQLAATKLNATVENWGFDFVYTTEVASFSSFYFASSAITTLPVDLEYFKGSLLGASNKLEWKASCTNDVDFIIERSTDGVNFQPAGKVWAAQADCGRPFIFIDDKAPAGNSYYRLKMDEKNGDISYSNIILLSREQTTGMQATLFPNPVTGTQATLRIHALRKATLQTVISDMAGRVLATRSIRVVEGLNTIPVQTQELKPGVYQLVLNDGEKNQVLRFIKQ